MCAASPARARSSRSPPGSENRGAGRWCEDRARRGSEREAAHLEELDVGEVTGLGVESDGRMSNQPNEHRRPASQVGEGVTSLGTTLAIKLLSDQPVSDPNRGIYSHRIKEMWLPGGASNSGGGVLLDHFSSEQMSRMEKDLKPATPTGFDYYPLSRPGERFPIADPLFPPRLTPRPEDDVEFFQAMLEGISEIERVGYSALQQLGAPAVKRVFSAGGGARNRAWMKIRSAKLGVPVADAKSTNASVGAARIAAGLI